MRAKFFFKSVLLAATIVADVLAHDFPETSGRSRPRQDAKRSRRALFRSWIRVARPRPFVRSNTLT